MNKLVWKGEKISLNSAEKDRFLKKIESMWSVSGKTSAKFQSGNSTGDLVMILFQSIRSYRPVTMSSEWSDSEEN